MGDLHSLFVLSHGRVILRPFSTQELMSDEYLRWMNDPRVTRTIGRFDYLLPVTRQKLMAYVEAIDKATTVFLAIYEGEAFVGTLKIYDIEPLSRRASLGIVVAPERWGKGIATAAIEAACGYVFGVLGFSKVSAGYLASNVGMHTAFQKTGFQIEGVLKRHLFIEGKMDDHVFVGRFS